MEISPSNELYGSFKVSVDERELTIEPNFAKNEVFYRVFENDTFLFTLQMNDNAQWVAINQQANPMRKAGPVNQDFAKPAGHAIEVLTK